MPFDNATNDSTLGVIGRMTADYITEGLSGLTTVEVVATSAAFAVSGSTAGPTSIDRVRDVADRTGARRVVSGAITAGRQPAHPRGDRRGIGQSVGEHRRCTGDSDEPDAAIADVRVG